MFRYMFKINAIMEWDEEAQCIELHNTKDPGQRGEKAHESLGIQRERRR